MDSRNNLEGALLFGVLSIVIFVVQFLFAVFATIALLLTAALSVVSILAIVNNGTTFMDETVTPHEGKMFFVRGFVGMIALPVFLGIVFAILGEQIPFTSQWIWLAGFVLGSTGVEYLIYQEQQEKAKAQGAVVLPPLPDYEPSKPVTPTVEPVKPFRFASWEDEEQGR